MNYFSSEYESTYGYSFNIKLSRNTRSIIVIPGGPESRSTFDADFIVFTVMIILTVGGAAQPSKLKNIGGGEYY